MSIALRFDNITVNGDGSIAVLYTYGNTPLPLTPAGTGLTFPSLQDAVKEKNGAIAKFGEKEMFMFAVAIYSIFASDPNLTGASALIGHTLTLDPTKPLALLAFS